MCESNVEPILKHGPLAAVLTTTMAWPLIVRSRVLRRDPEKWRTLLTNRTAWWLHAPRCAPVLLTMWCKLPMAFAIVSILINLSPARPVTTRVSAAPFALVGLHRTMSESMLRLTVVCSYEFPLMVPRRFMHLLSEPGCTCIVSGVPPKECLCAEVEKRLLTVTLRTN